MPHLCESLPGENPSSIGYHSEYGQIFMDSEASGRYYGPPWGKVGDIVGCGYIQNSGAVFFTKNGEYLGVAFTCSQNQLWFPSVGSDGFGKLEANFGDHGQ